MKTRNRSLQGEKHPTSVLSDDHVRDILNELYIGTTISQLANQYHASETAISNIANGYRWKHLYKCLEEHYIQQIHKNIFNNQLRNKITEKEVFQIRKLFKTGKYSYTDLKQMFNLNGITTVSNIVNYKSWKHVG